MNAPNPIRPNPIRPKHDVAFGGYHQVESEKTDLVPGNPWVICTLWQAMHAIEIATSVPELEKSLQYLEWVRARGMEPVLWRTANVCQSGDATCASGLLPDGVPGGTAGRISKLIAIGQAICEALVCLEENELAHGELRPANVLLDRDGQRLVPAIRSPRCRASLPIIHVQDG